MNRVQQIIWLFFTLAILVFSGRYYSKMESINKLNHEVLSSTVDITVSQLTIHKFNANGLLANRLTTPLMQHIPKNDIHLFQTPHIIIAQDNQPDWEIHSQKAKSFNGGQRIIFSQQVVVHQNPGNKIQESTLKTEEVTYFPKEKKATTDLFVTFEQPGNKVESRGMNAYLDEKRVELLHQARGSYVPAKG